MSLAIALETLGCKVNQYESSYFLEVLREAGHQLVPFQDVADVYIIHSCAVTSKASYQTRQLLRRARRYNPRALVMAVGCNAQLEADRIANEQLATHIIGTIEKSDLLHWLSVNGTFSAPCNAVGDARFASAMKPMPTTRMHSGRARAFLKIQDGCDAFCSYCIVPYTRGKSRSLPAALVRSQLDRYLGFGYREIVFTGIHMGQWGRDLNPEQDLLALLRFLATGPLPSRVRLSSLEPMECNSNLLDYLSSCSWICPHFHVPLQSGSTEILKSMNRPYSSEQYSELILAIHDRFPRAAIGADVMVGFPGETELHFQETAELVAQLPLNYLHVFPFSPRPDTPAVKQNDRVTGNTLKQRAKFLRLLDSRKRLAFRQQYLHDHVEVLVETELKPGLWRGTSDNYIQVVFSTERPMLPGSLAMVRLTKVDRSGVVSGELLTTL